MIARVAYLVIFTAVIAACALSSPTPPDSFCISAPRDGINDYLAENADAVAEQVVRNNLAVLRESSGGERYRIAKRANQPCGDDEELATSAELRAMLTAIGNSPRVATRDECTVQMPYRSEEESTLMLPYFFLSGLRYPTVGTQGPGEEVQIDGSIRRWPLTGHVHAKDSCAALNAMAAALLERRDSMQP